MNELSAGQFIPGSSPLHRLDARIKLLCFFLLLAAAVCASGPRQYLLPAVAAVAAAGISRLPPRIVFGQLARLRWFFPVIFLMNALFSGGGKVLWSGWIFTLTADGMLRGADVALRVALALTLGCVLTSVTPPMELAGAIEWLFSPLRLIRVPVDDAALILGCAIQFIPALLEETETLRLAQTARGARFESRNPLTRAACYLPLVIPIFLSAFRRADELASAMEARGCRGGLPVRRPRLRPGLSGALALGACGAVLLPCLL